MRHFRPRPLPTWSPGGDEEEGEEEGEEGEEEEGEGGAGAEGEEGDEEDVIDELEDADNDTISWEDEEEEGDIMLLNDTSRETTPEERLLRSVASIHEVSFLVL